MLLERMGETVTLEMADGTEAVVDHVLCREADVSDQSVIDVQTRFINQSRYKGDSRTITVYWPKTATHDLMDGHLVIRGERYRVHGAPFPVAHSPNGYDTRITCIRSLFLYECDLVRPAQEQDDWGIWHETGTDTVHTTCNLLRLSEQPEADMRTTSVLRRVLLELPPDTWDDEHPFTRFTFEGRDYGPVSVEVAGECVVISGTEVT